jgi:Xaa-Pro aminopeptidase
MTEPDRLSRLRARMAETGTDLVAVGPTSNLTWLSGIHAHGDERPVMQIVTRDTAALLMPALNADSVRTQTDLPFHEWTDAEGAEGALDRLLAAAAVKGRPVTVALDESMRADFALLLLDAITPARRGFLDATVGWLRARKDRGEYPILKANARICDVAMRAGFDALREGITETEVAEVLKRSFADQGAGTEFFSVCFGGNGAFPHYATGAARLEPGMAVLIDTGGRKDGYPSDMTRVGHFGPVPEDFAAIHAIVDQAVGAALAAARPGARARDVDAAARDVISAAGYGARFPHRVGHGLGVDIHEAPYITATSDTILEEGMVFSIEPGIYLPGRFGVRLEEIVFMHADGPEILSGLPRAALARG